jgi:hypothetical protein
VSQSQNYVTTDGLSASLSWCQAPIWGLWPDCYYCQTVAGLLMWVAFSDERTGLSFTIAAGPRQFSHSRVRVPWYLRTYFTISDMRLPLSSPPTTRRITLDVFDPASTRNVYVYLTHSFSVYKLGTNRTENMASNSTSIVVCAFVVAHTCLSSHYQAMSVFASHYVTILSIPTE